MQSNPENTVGVLTMAGKGPRVLITPTNDLGKILQALHGMASLDPHYEISLAGISSPDMFVFFILLRDCVDLWEFLNRPWYTYCSNKVSGILSGLEVGGEMSMTSGVQVAQLALKHRQNKHQRQRIVLFAGR